MDFSKFERWFWKGMVLLLSGVGLFVLGASTPDKKSQEDKGIVYVGKDGTILDFDNWEELLSYLMKRMEAEEVKDE